MRIGGAVSDARSRPSVRQAVEIILVALLATQAARLVWTVVTPIGPIGAPAVARPRTVAGPDLAILERFNPFSRSSAATAALPQATDAFQLGLRLHGVRGPMFGDRGSAILATPDGKQASYVVGDAVMPGVTLTAVAGDHVLLIQNGAQLRLPFAEFAGAPPTVPPAAPVAGSFVAPAIETPPPGVRLPPAPASAPAATATPLIDPARFLAEAGLRPRDPGRRSNGYVLNSRGRGEMLRQAGLQSGDVLLSVNGARLEDPERLDEMAAELRNSPEIEIQYERNGRVMTARVRTGQGTPQ